MKDVPDEVEPVTAVLNTQEMPAKRRRVRKGTRSCWECKRRKTRCIFASSEDAICIGCQRRRAPCVSQDMPEDLSPARHGNRHLGERIARVEDFMKDFVANKQHVGATCPQLDGRELRDDMPPSVSDAVKTPVRPGDPVPVSFRAPPTPAESLGESAPNPSFLSPEPQGVSGQVGIEATALHHLWAAFPAEGDARVLLRESARPALYTELTNTRQHSKLTREALAAPYCTAELPDPNTHPVLLAKRMLMFAIALRSPCGENIHGLSEPHSVLMHRFMTAATTWVTTKEEMHGTIDSLICIMLEGVFEINCGNLRRAWAVFRRAMTVAQLMGLHRSPMPPLKRIDPGLEADPEFLWFRIVYMDRYLSLLLGLPQGTSDKSMAAPSVLRHEPALGRFERLLTVIASRVLERNESTFAAGEIATTQSIDAKLLSVAKSMPASFWRPANFHNLTPGSPDTLLETVRLAAQVYYYGLLIQLHLPYMMHGAAGDNGGGAEHEHEHEYSKMTCVNAGREIMARFIAHRTFNPMSSCSRPVDFFALLAAMTLLLAHLDAHHQHQQRGLGTTATVATNFLAHQRLGDRAMLDQALERMDVISRVNGDVITGKSAALIRRLLDIEADAADGSSYTASSSVAREGGGGGDEDGDDTQEGAEERGDGALRLHIPYLGVVRIARGGPVSREHPPAAPQLSHQASPSSSPSSSSRLGLAPSSQQVHPALAASYDDAFAPLSNSNDVTSSPVDVAERQLHEVCPRGSAPFPGDLSPSGRQGVVQFYAPGYVEQSMLQYHPGSGQEDIALQQHGDLPAIAAGIDDWAFQGVDMAFFDSLMRGTSCPNVDATGLEQRMTHHDTAKKC